MSYSRDTTMKKEGFLRKGCESRFVSVLNTVEQKSAVRTIRWTAHCSLGQFW